MKLDADSVFIVCSAEIVQNEESEHLELWPINSDALVVAQNSETDKMIAFSATEDVSTSTFFESDDGMWTDVVEPYIATISESSLGEIFGAKLSEQDLCALITNTVDNQESNVGGNNVKFLDSSACLNYDGELAEFVGSKGVLIYSIQDVELRIDSKRKKIKLDGEEITDCLELRAFLLDRGVQNASVLI